MDKNGADGQYPGNNNTVPHPFCYRDDDAQVFLASIACGTFHKVFPAGQYNLAEWSIVWIGDVFRSRDFNMFLHIRKEKVNRENGVVRGETAWYGVENGRRILQIWSNDNMMDDQGVAVFPAFIPTVCADVSCWWSWSVR